MKQDEYNKLAAELVNLNELAEKIGALRKQVAHRRKVLRNVLSLHDQAGNYMSPGESRSAFFEAMKGFSKIWEEEQERRKAEMAEDRARWDKAFGI